MFTGRLFVFAELILVVEKMAKAQDLATILSFYAD